MSPYRVNFASSAPECLSSDRAVQDSPSMCKTIIRTEILEGIAEFAGMQRGETSTKLEEDEIFNCNMRCEGAIDVTVERAGKQETIKVCAAQVTSMTIETS